MINLHTNSSLEYKIERVRNGKVIGGMKNFRPHLITDYGLEQLASNSAASLISSVQLGESVSPTPSRRDSGSVTFTQTGSTITASSGFFEANDVGRLFKWGTGESGVEVYIDAFISSTEVTVRDSATVSTPEVGVVWYVNVSTLLTPITGLTFSKQNNGSENNTTFATSGNALIVTHKITHYSSAFASPKTVSEILFGGGFDRDNVMPSVGFLVNDQAKITVQLIVRYAPITGVPVGNVGTGCDTSGTLQIENLHVDASSQAIACVNSAGGVGTNGYPYMENSSVDQAPYMGLLLSDFTQGAFVSSGGELRTSVNGSASVLPYGAGSRYRDRKVTFSIAQGNGTIYGLCMNSYEYTLSLKLTNPFAKTSAQTFEFVFRFSWGRVLSN